MIRSPWARSPPDDVILAGSLASRAENDDTIDLAVLGGLKNRPR